MSTKPVHPHARLRQSEREECPDQRGDDVSASSPKMGMPAATPMRSALSSLVARGLPNRESVTDNPILARRLAFIITIAGSAGCGPSTYGTHQTASRKQCV